MAQIRYGDGSDAPATEVITVADLLSRNAPVPVQRAEPDTGGITVGALLQREGRSPHGDRPFKVRPDRSEPTDTGAGAGRSALVRRGAIAAGTLLAAGSVLGAAILTDVTPTATQTPGTGGAEDDGPYPGQGLLDQEDPAAALPDTVAIDQAAARDPLLDPGTPAPSDWIPVAFPSAIDGEDDDTDDGADQAGSGSSGSSGSASQASATSDDDDDEPAQESSSSGSSSKSSSSSSGGSSSGSSGSSESDDDRSGDGDDDSEDDGGSDDDDDDGDGDDDGDRGLVGSLLGTVGGLVR